MFLPLMVIGTASKMLKKATSGIKKWNQERIAKREEKKKSEQTKTWNRKPLTYEQTREKIAKIVERNRPFFEKKLAEQKAAEKENTIKKPTATKLNFEEQKAIREKEVKEEEQVKGRRRFAAVASAERVTIPKEKLEQIIDDIVFKFGDFSAEQYNILKRSLSGEQLREVQDYFVVRGLMEVEGDIRRVQQILEEEDFIHLVNLIQKNKKRFDFIKQHITQAFQEAQQQSQS